MSSKRRFKFHGVWVNHFEYRGMIRRGRNAAKWFQISWALRYGGGMNRRIKNYLRGAGFSVAEFETESERRNIPAQGGAV